MDMLLAAYAAGIFPWYSDDSPILWWSPDPRCILFPEKFHVSRRSRRKIRNSGFIVTGNKAFASVIRACAKPRKEDPGTWLVEDMILAYEKLHMAGYAQSVEVWQNGRLAGGLYGVCMGKAFFGESMFHNVPEASRCALQYLVDEAKSAGFLFIDCQQATPHMLAMGAECMPRRDFTQLLAEALS